MSYEIPQQLEYNEKVVFELTFSQLAWAMLFGLPAAGIFLKSSLNIYVKSTIAIILCFCAILFMFFKASKFIKDYYVWLKFRKADRSSSKLKKFVGVKRTLPFKKRDNRTISQYPHKNHCFKLKNANIFFNNISCVLICSHILGIYVVILNLKFSICFYSYCICIQLKL